MCVCVGSLDGMVFLEVGMSEVVSVGLVDLETIFCSWRSMCLVLAVKVVAY